MSTVARRATNGRLVVAPVHVFEADLADPLQPVDASGRSPIPRAARGLVRLHGEPLGLVSIDLQAGRCSRDALAAALSEQIGTSVSRHLKRDGASSFDVPIDGVGADAPPCLLARRRFLTTTPPVTVIIPTRERPDALKRCLRSVLASEFPAAKLEIVVVDNIPSTSATRDVVEGFGCRVEYAVCDVPGSASARNVGLRQARGEYVLFTDDDVIVDRHWVAEMAKAFTSAPNVACVTGLVLPGELESPAQLLFEEYGGFGKGWDRVIYDTELHRPEDPMFPYAAGKYGSGNSMAFSRRTLVDLGGFDPALGNGTPTLGGVDIEAFLRVILAGYALVYEPAALVYHSHRREYAALERQIYAYGVGLTAVLTRTVLHQPRVLPDLLRKTPAGLRYAVSRSSGKHAGKTAAYPRTLRLRELAGMAMGPLAYARSQRRYRGADSVAAAEAST